MAFSPFVVSPRYDGGGASLTRKYVETGASPEYAIWNGTKFGEHVGRVFVVGGASSSLGGGGGSVVILKE